MKRLALIFVLAMASAASACDEFIKVSFASLPVNITPQHRWALWVQVNFDTPAIWLNRKYTFAQFLNDIPPKDHTHFFVPVNNANVIKCWVAIYPPAGQGEASMGTTTKGIYGNCQHTHVAGNVYIGHHINVPAHYVGSHFIPVPADP